MYVATRIGTNTHRNNQHNWPSCVVADFVRDVQTSLNTTADPNLTEVKEHLVEAKRVAQEAFYRQQSIDLLRLAIEHTEILIENTTPSNNDTASYTVPPHNIPREVRPQEYSKPAVLEH